MGIPLYQQLYDSLLTEIRTGQLKSGDRVPSEKELANQFHVSMITSKKALEKLHQEQFIRRVRGKGSFVASEIPAAFKALGAAKPSEPLQDSGYLVGLILPDFDDSYGLRVVRAVEAHCAERGCHLILKTTHGNPEDETRAIRECLQIGVQGLLICPVHGEYYNADLLRLVLDEFPLVLVDRYIKGIPACTVSVDNTHAALHLTNYLLDRGHKQIVFVSPPVENTSAIQERMQGFAMAVAQHGLPLGDSYYLTDLYSTLPNSFYGENIIKDEATLESFFAAHPHVTAVMACEYNLAVLIARVFERRGRSAANGYQIGCFDSPHSAAEQPFFTHIEQDEVAMGRAAVDLLLAQLQHQPHTKHTLIDFQLVEGHSTR